MIRLLRRNLAIMYGGYAVSIASALVATPIIVDALGKERYGLWVFIGALTVYLGLMDFGVGPAVIRFAALERGRRGDVAGLASTATAVYAAVGLVSAGLAVGLAWLVPELIEVPAELVWPARVATLLVAGTVLVRFPFVVGQSLLVAAQRFDVTNVAGAASLVLYTALVVWLLPGSGSLVLLAGLALAAAAFRYLTPLPWVPREYPGLRVSPRLVTRGRTRELLGFSWYSLLIQIAAKLVTSMDVIVIGVILGPEAAALYGVPSRLFGLGLSLGTVGTNIVFPAFSELEGRAEYARQVDLLLVALRAGMALMAVVALPLALVPDLIIRGWIGPGFEDSTPVLVLLALALVAHQPANVLSHYLSARARQRELAFVSLGVVSANLGLSIALAFTVGIWGVALATLVTLLFETVFLVPRLAERAGGPRPAAVARASLRPLLPAALAAALVLGAGGRLLEPDHIPGLAALAAAWL
ncbi:MAG: oligosaccharide flippase family protein, partial [Gaiellaceae bacterium]